jgi:membrane-associated PAP2 superfamily phosphatase
MTANINADAQALERFGPSACSSEPAESKHVVSAVNVEGIHFERQWPVVLPMLCLIAASIVIAMTDFDLRASMMFYNQTTRRWTYDVSEPWMTIYRQGTIPSFILGIGGLMVALLGKRIVPRAAWDDLPQIRRAGWFLIILLILGPGLIINWGFKELWGRPRPIQCVEFGGQKEFLSIGIWAREHASNSSFPSGHAAVAFYLMAPGFIVGRNRPRLKIASFALGACYGLGMGLTRVLQGGHFVSDVLWAGAMVYLTGVALAWLLLHNEPERVMASATSV